MESLVRKRSTAKAINVPLRDLKQIAHWLAAPRWMLRNTILIFTVSSRTGHLASIKMIIGSTIFASAVIVSAAFVAAPVFRMVKFVWTSMTAVARFAVMSIWNPTVRWFAAYLLHSIIQNTGASKPKAILVWLLTEFRPTASAPR